MNSHSRLRRPGTEAGVVSVKRRRLSSEFYEQRHREKVIAHLSERVPQNPGSSTIPEVARELQSFLRLEDERIRVADRLGATGEWTARARAFVIDVLIDQVLRVAKSILAKDEVRRLGRLSVLALGGYGRSELSPFSDLDLLFLYSGNPSKQTRQVIERCLHLLWDAGLNVGQKSFAVEECVSSARRDPHFQTALVTLRLVAGEGSLAERLQGRLERERLKNGTALIETVQRERDERYQRRSAAIYLQEPNVKESAGGLRDLHSALWASYARYGCRTLVELRAQGLIDDQQYELATQSYDFLLRLRHHAHWITGRKTDYFALDLQEALAQKLGYTGSAHLQPSELLMRDYYRNARELHHFSDLLFARATERPDHGRRWFVRSKREELDELFSVADGRIILDSKAKLSPPAPFLFFRALAHAQNTGATFSPDLRDDIRRNLGLMDRTFRNSRKAAQAFVSILRQSGRVAPALRLMHETELLGRYLPEFGRISFLIQHDLYHHYTVDEHTLRTIEALDDLFNSDDQHRAPLRNALAEVEDVALLYLALLLHDLGKGRGRGHIPRGARIAEPICQRLNLNSESTKKIVQLVRQHVYMAHISQRRDLGEHRLAAAFASEVGTLDLLNMLYVLTYADLNGVGPGVWSEWKGNLLHELYNLARGFLAGGNEPSDLLASMKNQVIESLLGKVPVSVIERHFALLPQRYTRVATPETVASHLTLIAELEHLELPCNWRERGGGATELTICARDRRGLFANLAGALAANGIEILSADVNTREDGIAIDTFILREAATRRAVDRRRWGGLQRSLTASVQGQHDIAALVERWRTRHAPRRRKAFTPVNHSKLQIVCSNEIAEATTVIEVRAPDETGLAFKIANALTNSGLDIVCARIATEKSDALDVFYVTDSSGSKLVEGQIVELENMLMRWLSTV